MKRARRAPAPVTDAPPAPTPPRSNVAAPLVLVVDDYEDNREMYASYLEFAGMRIEQAVNGSEAITKAVTLLPDLIVMDLSLPGVDGWEATRRLKQDVRTKSILVLALTGHALEGAEQGAKEAGCDAFLTKPCLPEDLCREIHRMLAAAPPARKNGRSRR